MSGRRRGDDDGRGWHLSDTQDRVSRQGDRQRHLSGVVRRSGGNNASIIIGDLADCARPFSVRCIRAPNTGPDRHTGVAGNRPLVGAEDRQHPKSVVLLI